MLEPSTSFGIVSSGQIGWMWVRRRIPLWSVPWSRHRPRHHQCLCRHLRFARTLRNVWWRRPQKCCPCVLLVCRSVCGLTSCQQLGGTLRGLGCIILTVTILLPTRELLVPGLLIPSRNSGRVSASGIITWAACFVPCGTARALYAWRCAQVARRFCGQAGVAF